PTPRHPPVQRPNPDYSYSAVVGVPETGSGGPGHSSRGLLSRVQEGLDEVSFPEQPLLGQGRLASKDLVQQGRIAGPRSRRRGPPGAGRQGLLPHATFRLIMAEQVADVVRQDGQQVQAVLLALVAGLDELRILPRRRIDEPAPAGGVGVGRGGVAGCQGGRLGTGGGGGDVASLE